MVLDCSLLHLAICGERPLFLRALHQAGYQVAVVATMFKITPVKDAVRGIQCSGFPCRCGEMLGELFPLLQDHFEKEKGRQDLTAALELSKCGNMKRLLGRELKRVELRKKLEDRKSQQKPEEEGKPAKKCWKCGISSSKVDLSKCSACRRAWYCGEKCQKADWESHWQWCQQKVESRNKKEMNRGHQIEEKCKTGHGTESRDKGAGAFEPFPRNSLAYELD